MRKILYAVVILGAGLALLYPWDRASADERTVDPHMEKNQVKPAPAQTTVGQTEPTGITIVVSNSGNEVNGNTADPYSLILDPGPDGISLYEAMLAVGADNGLPETITFSPALMGATIINSGMPAIVQDGVHIDGDLDDDGLPDITLDGNGSPDHCFSIWGASYVTIEGIAMKNFGGNGVTVSEYPGTNGVHFSHIAIRNNAITNLSNDAIGIMLNQAHHSSIRNIEISGNRMEYNTGGIDIGAGGDASASYNELSDIAIISNTITNPGYHIGIFMQVAGIYEGGNGHNSIRRVLIRGNTITRHSNTSLLMSAANRNGVMDALLEDVTISHNLIDGTPVTIEIIAVGEGGTNTSGNQVRNVRITDNMLVHGGVMFVSGTAANASYNTVAGLLIERNQILSCMANGVYLSAGNSGASINVLEDAIIRNNFIHGALNAGILLHGESSTSPFNEMRNIQITNNTLTNNAIGSSWAGGLNVNTKHASNSITEVVVTNTILWGNAGNDSVRGSVAPQSVSYSILNDGRFTGSSGNFYQNPGFVNAPGGDYRLGADSPALDTGDPSGGGSGALDLNGNARLWDGDGDMVAIVDRGAWEYGALKAQDIEVRGQGVVIISGNTTANLVDGTDYGYTHVGGEAVMRTFTIWNRGAQTLTLTGDVRVEISGSREGDFWVDSQPASEISAGGMTSFTIGFDPAGAAMQTARVVVESDDPDENPYTFFIRGAGAYPPYVNFWQEAYTCDERDGTVPVTVTLSRQSELTITVVVSITGGTAVPGDDFLWTGGLLTFAPMSWNQVFWMTIIDDGLNEDSETIVLGLFAPTHAQPGLQSQFTLTIRGHHRIYLPLVVR